VDPDSYPPQKVMDTQHWFFAWIIVSFLSSIFDVSSFLFSVGEQGANIRSTIADGSYLPLIFTAPDVKQRTYYSALLLTSISSSRQNVPERLCTNR
jgi:hypothetical protein